MQEKLKTIVMQYLEPISIQAEKVNRKWKKIAPKDLDIRTCFVLKNSRNKFDWLVHEVLLFGELIMSNKE